MFRKILLFNALFFIYCANVSAIFKYDSLNCTLKTNLSAGTKIILGYYLGERTFRKGIIDIGENGEGSLCSSAHEGLYFLVFPDTSTYEFLVTEGTSYEFNINLTDDRYSVTLSANDVSEAFASYRKETNEISNEIAELRRSKANTPDEKAGNTSRLFSLKSKMDSLSNVYRIAYQGTLLGNWLKAQQPVDVPQLTLPDDTPKRDSLRWMMGIRYFRNHYLDNITWSDSRLMYTPILANKISVYLDKIANQNPDSLVKAVDEILGRTEDSDFRTFLDEFLLRKFERTKYQPVSEYVFAHIIRHYLDDETDVSPEEKQKLETELNRIQPAMLESIAPDISLPGKDLQRFSLHSIKADHILLIFWEPGCSTCTSVIGQLIPVLSKYNYMDIKVFTVSTGQSLKEWDDYTAHKFPKSWVNVYQTATGKPSQVYNISYTPSLFLLDSDRRILAKYFTVAELDDLLFGLATSKN